MKTTRRAHLLAWASSVALALPASAWARRRLRYGGRAQFSLPLATTSLDPHDPEDLTSALFGSSCFEPLYARSASGKPYPTLAESLPTLEKNRLTIRLRPDLVTARGEAISAERVVASLARSAGRLPYLKSLGGARTEGAGALSFPAGDPEALALRLALPGSALVGSKFNPRAVDATGAFRARLDASGIVFERNPNAPRGGALLDRVTLSTATLSESLRSFEAGTSDVGWLGAGLHEARRDGAPFRLNALGLVVALAGKRQARFFSEGVLQAALDGAEIPTLPSLGVTRENKPGARFIPPRASILCARECPQLVEIARSIAEAWSNGSSTIDLDIVPRDTFDARRAAGDFDLLVTFLQTSELSTSDVHLSLVALAGAPLPTGNFVAEAPARLARRLRLGVVGQFAPTGFVDPELAGLVRAGKMDLSQLERVTPAR